MWKYNLITDLLNFVEEKNKSIIGEAYLGYPIFIDNFNNKMFTVDLALVTNKGFFIFNFLEEKILCYTDLQDQLYNKVENKLKKYDFLMKGRNLFFTINVATYSEAQGIDAVYNYPLLYSSEDFYNLIITNEENLSEEEMKKVIAGIQESYGINNRFIRDGAKENSKGFLINKMNEFIETHDNSQMDAILENPAGIQRIRGMAGSGKTIVLARKAVELHTVHPEWNIIVTYQTRSLKNQFITLINKFYSIKNEGKLPNYDKLKIMQAWGSETSNGLYYEICLNNEIEPMSYRDAKLQYGSKNTFSKLCQSILNSEKILKRTYDCILIDEAQDFDENFLKLCIKTLTLDENLVYAYDELQALNELSMLDPIEIFGKHISHDTPLKTCYRNQGNVIVTAHALGMGLYRKEGLLQLPGSSDVWKSIGYSCDEPLIEGKKVVLYRTPETSPDKLGADPNGLIDFIKADDTNNMYEKLLASIKINLEEDCLDSKDIMIIDMDAISVNENYQKLLLLNDNNYSINIHKAGSKNPEDFFRNNSVVYSTIYRAKGNEAYYVYVLNAQKCIGTLSKIKERNSLFTAITRSKGWVKVIGIGDDMDSLIQEYNLIKENNYKLVFDKYPTKEEQEKLLLNNQDIDEPDQKTLDNARKVIGRLKDKIPTEDIVKELLGPDYQKIIEGMLDKDVQE